MVSTSLTLRRYCPYTYVVYLDTGGPSVLFSQRRRRSGFLRRHSPALGASGDISEEELQQAHVRGKRQVKVTEKAK
jgi:hypothetical protein